jgi:hypothetical protein
MTAQASLGVEGRPTKNPVPVAAPHSFHGSVREILLQPPSDDMVDIRADGIIFISVIHYRRTLTRAFGPGGWWIVPNHDVDETDPLKKVLRYRGTLYVNGRYVSEAVGEHEYDPASDSLGDAREAAKSNCLMRCCKDVGIYSELWDRSFVDAWKSRFATRAVDGSWQRRRRPPIKPESAEAALAAIHEENLRSVVRPQYIGHDRISKFNRIARDDGWLDEEKTVLLADYGISALRFIPADGGTYDELLAHRSNGTTLPALRERLENERLEGESNAVER